MRFYTTQHKDYYGIDLHARTLYVCTLDQSSEVFVTSLSPDDILIHRKRFKGKPTLKHYILWTHNIKPTSIDRIIKHPFLTF